MEDIEKWVDCSGDLEGLYEVSDHGNIRNKKNKRVLSSWKNKKLQRVYLYTKVGRQCVSVKQLIASTFVPNPNNYRFVKFKDNNRNNMHPDNLYWSNCVVQMTKEAEERRRNVNSRRLLGRVGCDAMASKPIICVETSTVYFTASEAAEVTGVSQQAIQFAVDKENRTAAGYHWKHIKIYKKED